MGIIDKIKLLFQARKPVEEIVGQLQEVKRGWKTVSFWVSLIGSLISGFAAVKGFVSAETAMMITTALTTVYNVLRGLEKSSEDGIRPPLISTEFWVGVLGILMNSLAQLQASGMNTKWLTISTAIMAGAMATAQNLGAHKIPPATAEPDRK